MERRGYRVTIRHDGLNEVRVVTGRTLLEVNQKADAQKAAWNQQWARKLEQDAMEAGRERVQRDAER